MEPVPTPKKLSRNAPCPCGSGRKFKKCCGKEKHKMEHEPLKNDFRKEIRDPYAGIPGDELAKRDQLVLLKEVRFRVEGIKADRKHITEAIEKAKALRLELLALPKSPGREAAIKDLEAQIGNNKKQIEALKVPRQMLITLLALEELLEKPALGIPVPDDYDLDQALNSAPLPQEDDGPDELSDDDDPEEVI